MIDDTTPTTTPNPMDKFIDKLSTIKGDAKTQDEVLLKTYSDQVEELRKKNPKTQHDSDAIDRLLDKIVTIKSRMK